MSVRTTEQALTRWLDEAQIRQFIERGLVRLDYAFPAELAAEARALLWRETGCDPDDPSTWTRPVIRLGYSGEEPFRKAVKRGCASVMPRMMLESLGYERA